MSLEQRTERGEKLVQQMLGPEFAQSVRKIWREASPDFDAYVTEFLMGEIWSRSGLDLRTRSLVTISTLAALGRLRPLELNVRFALGNGATPQEIRETLLQIAPYAGFPVAWEGLTIAAKVFRETGHASEGNPPA